LILDAPILVLYVFRNNPLSVRHDLKNFWRTGYFTFF